MNNKGSHKDLDFFLGELIKVNHLRILDENCLPLQAGTANLKKIIPDDLNIDLAQKISNYIGLTFILENPSTGNVCMANELEVMPEFREICTGTDLLNYVIVVIDSEENSKKLKNQEEIYTIRLSFPEDAAIFWTQVENGRKLKSHLYKE